MSGSPPGRAAAARGVSLIELMVALVLGLIVTGSALTLAMTNQRTAAATQSMGRVQENARVAFELMTRELRAASGNPCDTRLTVANGLNDPAANWWSNWGDPDGPAGSTLPQPGMKGYAAATAFGDAPFGTAAGQRVNGTAAVELKAAVPISADFAVLTLDLPILTDDATVSSTDQVHAGDLLLICDYYNASLFQATGLGTGTIKHAAGTDDWENETGAIDRRDSTHGFGPGSVVSRVRASRWYVGYNGRDTDGDGSADGRSLYRALLVNDGGTLREETDEIVEGVTDMQITYLVEGANDYVAAGSVADWDDAASPVVAARVNLTLSGTERVGASGEKIERHLVETIAFRNLAG